MPAFFGSVLPCRRPLAATPVNSNNQYNFISELTTISNCAYKHFIISADNKNEKNIVNPLITSVPISGEWKPQFFKQLFVEHCLSDFFALRKENREQIQETYDNAKEYSVHETIRLYACINYIVGHYIKTCNIQNQKNAIKFYKHMKKLSNLTNGDGFDKSSKFSFHLDGKRRNYPPLKILLEKIGKDIVNIFGNGAGPSNEIIFNLLRNHSAVRCNDKYFKIVINHSYDVVINNTRNTNAEMAFSERQRTLSCPSYAGEKLIRWLGFMTLNQCLKIIENK